MLLYAGTIFLSAFLLFLVQPIIAKEILPWFGGSAAVWATCMVFFQVMLLAGYAYAHWTTRRMAPRRQAMLHIVLLGASLLLLPIIPDAAWKPKGGENPSWLIVGLLSVTIGLPYMLVSTTTPLVQAWFARRYRQAIPYRLFALSNLASLLALSSYPVAIEPRVTVRAQCITWSLVYGAFTLLCAWIALGNARVKAITQDVGDVEASRNPIEIGPSAGQQIEWLALAAMGSFMLLAVTNHICQNVASIPFLWVVLLSIYLASFIFSFDHPRWYRRNLFLVGAAGMVLAMAWYSDPLELKVVVPIYMAGLFACCMFCHGELALSRPARSFLTTFYLMISLGGAVGGLLVGIVAPYLLAGCFEIGIGLVACAVLLACRARSLGSWAVNLGILLVGASALLVGIGIVNQVKDSHVMRRNFYAAVSTSDSSDPFPFRSLVHGDIVHSGQLMEPGRRLEASTYFGPGSGFARLFSSLPGAPRRVGVLGLGAGSILSFGRKGDVFRFYEINPQVVELARSEFTFLNDSPAKSEIVLGDGRLSLEQEPSQQFDVLAMDAFSGDSIPLHLLTREAIAIYLKHLKPGGVLAFQATNRFLDIVPIVAKLAVEHRLTAVLISDEPEDIGDGTSDWLYQTDQILVTANEDLLRAPRIQSAAKVIPVAPNIPAWTDNYNNLFRILKIWRN
jgi:hypothetical protein